jgi:hypothetical protein
VLKSVVSFLRDYEKDLLDSVSNDVLADVLFCIARVIEADKEIQRSGNLYIKQVAFEFNKIFYGDYTSRVTRRVDTREGPLIITGQVVSARKIGAYVDKLGLNKERDSDGIFIPVHKEAKKIQTLVQRYGLSKSLVESRKYLDYPKNQVPVIKKTGDSAENTHLPVFNEDETLDELFF